jgi:hypothetical protein
MAKATKLGDLLIGIQLQTKALEQGLNEVKKQLNKHGSDVRKTGADYEKLAIVAGVAFYKIVDSISKGVDAYNKFNSASVGLKSVVQGTGQDFKQAQKFIDQYIQDGLIPAANAMTAYKNLASRGYGQDQIIETMNRLKDSAAFGRQASLTMGEAVQSATEGLKNENSILVDNAGVTKNVSKMWEEYAATVGKTVNELSKAEKIQAEYLGIMKETRFQIGDAAKYSKEFAGAQAQNAAATLKLSQAYGQSLAPILREMYAIMTPLIQSITSFVQENETLVGTSTMVIAAALGMITIFTSLRAASLLLGPAIAGLKVALTGLLAHPVILTLAALAAVIGYVVVKNQQAKRATEEYNAALAEHNRLIKEGVSDAQVAGEQEKIDKLKELSKQYDEATAKYNEYIAASKDIPASSRQAAIKYNSENQAQIREYTKDIANLKAEMKAYGATEETVAKIIAEKEEALKKAQQATTEELNSAARDIAQKRVDIITTEALINTYKNAAKGSNEWKDAQQKLADQFPQFSTASGIIIDAIEAITKTENDNVANEWKNLQDKVKIAAAEIQLESEKKRAKLAALEASRDAMIENEVMSTVFLNKLTKITAAIAAQRALLDGDMSALDALNALAKSTVNDITGIKPVDLGKYTSSYENKAMNSALKVMEHKKRMDQLTLEDEVTTLDSILKKHARTADEKMELEERLYEAKKALLEKEKKDNEDYLDSLEQNIRDRTDASFNWVDDKKAYGDLSGAEEIAAYERMIKYHKEYLDERMKDTRLEKAEKDRLYASELVTIKDLERKILEVKKSAVEQSVNDYIDRKRKQYDWEEEQERDALNQKLAALDKEYAAKESKLRAKDRKEELNSLYAEEKKYLNAATEEGKNRLKQIQDDIKRLNREGEKDRMEEEKASREEAIKKEIKDNQEKYKTLKDSLDTSQKEMLAAASEFAKESDTLMTDATNSFGDSLLRMFKLFDTNNDSLMKQGLDKLRSFAAEYSKIMNSLQLDPSKLFTSNNIVTPAAAGAGGNNYIVNDYGAKIINSKDEAIDYTQELFDTAKNLTRGK